jgi:hypothetical protein
MSPDLPPDDLSLRGPSASPSGAAESERLEGWVAGLHRRAGKALCVLAGMAAAVWLASRLSDTPDDTAAGLIFATWLGPSGAMFLMAYQALRRRWLARWLLQLVPWLWLVGFWSLFAAVFG